MIADTTKVHIFTGKRNAGRIVQFLFEIGGSVCLARGVEIKDGGEKGLQL